MHTPVLLKEVVEGLNITSVGIYIDATVGEGGHLREIAKRGGRVLGIDADKEQIKKIKRVILNETKWSEKSSDSVTTSSRSFATAQDDIKLVQGNFADIEQIAKETEFFPVDGILFDLGLSIAQIENSGRGFSYKKLDEPLDMRMSNDYETTAADLINTLNEDSLYDILAKYGEDVNSLKISQEIIRARQKRKIERVGDLLPVLDKVLGNKDTRTYARIFQALRIAVNGEFENLRKGLDGSLKILKKNGRVAVISFHSLEDRIIKQFISKNNLKQLNKKVITSRRVWEFEKSAKLRIFTTT